MRGLWLAISLAIAVIGAATVFFTVRTRDGKASAAGLRVVHPEQRKIRSLVNATGTVRLRVGSEVRVGSQLSGIVKRLHVTVGSHVRAGDVIAEIDDRTIQARLADANAQIELDRAGVERAQVDYERAERLAAQGLVPLQQKQDLELAWHEAKARLDKSMRARDLVAVDLAYVPIRAPISGTVASVSTQEGETVAAAFAAPTFVTIIADHALQLIAMVDETDIASVAPGNPVIFTVEAHPMREFAGVVERIAPKATIVSGVVNYEVMVAVNRGADSLKPDMTANISIRTSERQALMVPNGAVQREGEQRYVYVDEAGHLARRLVSVGVREGGATEIKKGLTASDRVVTWAPRAPAPQSAPARTGAGGGNQDP